MDGFGEKFEGCFPFCGVRTLRACRDKHKSYKLIEKGPSFTKLRGKWKLPIFAGGSLPEWIGTNAKVTHLRSFCGSAQLVTNSGNLCLYRTGSVPEAASTY